MKVSIDLCMVPLGVGVSVSTYVAECQRVFLDHGLEPHMHGYGTGVEGEWEQVMTAVKQCFKALHDMGAPRVHATMRMGTRTDRPQTLQDKIDSVVDKLK